MTARQDVHKIGFELICRYSVIRTRLAAVARKAAILQEFFEKGCAGAAATTITRWKVSGTQRVFEVIQQSQNGVDPLFIKEVTGFNEQKIARILHKLFKYGQIRIESGGLYLPAAIR